MGVRLMNLAAGDSLVAIARNAESPHAAVNGDDAGDDAGDESAEGPAEGLADGSADSSADTDGPGDDGPEATN
jgi:hypothetical protein